MSLIAMNKCKIHIVFKEPVLGSLNNNVNVFSKYIASKAPTPEKKAEEIATIQGEMTDEEVAEQIEEQTTVFPKNKDGQCFCYDYQWRGFFKEALIVGTEIGEKMMGKLSRWSIKKTVDSMLFVVERRILFLDAAGNPISEVQQLERPLRAMTQRGERICLARSEIIPADAQVTFNLTWLENRNRDSKQRITRECLLWALEYGSLKGFGQWRGGGYGRFGYTLTDIEMVAPEKEEDEEAAANKTGKKLKKAA